MVGFTEMHLPMLSCCAACSARVSFVLASAFDSRAHDSLTFRDSLHDFDVAYS